MNKSRVLVSSKQVPKDLAKLLKTENGDVYFHFDDKTYLKRKQGTLDIYLHRDDKTINLEHATLEDFDFVYIKPFFDSVVRGTDKLLIDKSLFLDDEVIIGMPKTKLLELLDKLTFSHCEQCPVRGVSKAEISLNNYCLVSCPVGIEIQNIGAAYEKPVKDKKAKHSNKAKVTKETKREKEMEIPVKETSEEPTDLQPIQVEKEPTAKEKMQCLRDDVNTRRLKSIRALYARLVSPKKVSQGVLDEAEVELDIDFD